MAVAVAAAVAAIAATAPGCASYTQTQYFAAVSLPDPVTGIANKNYYKMTVHGSAPLMQKYNMKGAYLSAQAVDVLTGSEVKIPIVDIPPDNQKKFDELKNIYLDTLIQYAEAERDRGGTLSPEEHEARVLTMARQAWFASLSDGDLVSAGQLKTADPYQFRKLVFYATASDINLEQGGLAIDSAIGNVELLAEAFRSKQQAEDEARKLKQREQVEMLKWLYGVSKLRSHDSAFSFIDSLPITPQQKADVKKLFDVTIPPDFPATESTEAKESTEGGANP